MAYATTNPPVAISMGPLAEFNTTEAPVVGGKLWKYASADVIGTVTGAGYFSNGQSLGMQLYDAVLIIDTTTPHVYLGVVSAINAATGAVTVVQGATLL